MEQPRRMAPSASQAARHGRLQEMKIGIAGIGKMGGAIAARLAGVRLECAGLVGAGPRRSLERTLPFFVYGRALGGALWLAQHLKLDRVPTRDTLAAPPGGPAMLKNRAGAIAAALAGKDNPPSVTIDTLKKDLAEMVAEARACGYDAPVTASALASFERASRAGLGAKDCTAMPTNWVRGRSPN